MRQINDINLSAFTDRVITTPWLPTNEPNVNIDYEQFHNRLFNIYNESFLVNIKASKIYKNKTKSWLTVGILNSVKEKNQLYKKFMQRKSLKVKLKYLNFKNKLTKIIRSLRKCIMKKNVINSKVILEEPGNLLIIFNRRTQVSPNNLQ